MLDVAYAVLLEQFEQDGRAVVAAGASEHPPQWYRDALDDVLTSERDPSEAPERAPVSPEVQELREALGVA